MAVVDSDYKFLYVDVGSNGKVSDGGVFNACSLSNALERDLLNVPPPAPLPGDHKPIPYHLVADEAFALKNYIMKPYPHRGLTKGQRVCNYRFSRGRRVVENGFGIMSNRFRVFLSTIAVEEQTVIKIVFASIVLHNYLREKIGCHYITKVVDKEIGENRDLKLGSWREDPKIPQVKIAGGKRRQIS